MLVKDFDYPLRDELIAQKPVTPRDSSRLLMVNRDEKSVTDKKFTDLPSYFEKGDLLVLNDTKVYPARMFGNKLDTGANVELLLLKTTGSDIWEALARPGKKIKPGTVISFGGDILRAEAIFDTEDGGKIVRLYPGEKSNTDIVIDLVHQLGELPLPPYITDGPKRDERDVYQTIYAKYEGSSAAPTAGLHFTENIFSELKSRGVEFAYVTLHIGLGTFRPMQTEHCEDHVMHYESYSITSETASAVERAKKSGKRVVAVGTTTTRTLEAVASENDGKIVPCSGETNLYIRPGFDFKVVDTLVTNFHQPKSTLLLLVSAFASQELIFKAYNHAIDEEYRFLSFGDSMLIL